MDILIVEDNEPNLKVLLSTLKRMGFKPDCCVNGSEAIKAVEQKHYDLVFIDLQMPVMDGFEATQKINEMKGTQAPIISAFTANSSQSNRDRCNRLGMHDFISKPTTPERIEKTIRGAFQKLEEQKQRASFQTAMGQ